MTYLEPLILILCEGLRTELRKIVILFEGAGVKHKLGLSRKKMLGLLGSTLSIVDRIGTSLESDEIGSNRKRRIISVFG